MRDSDVFIVLKPNQIVVDKDILLAEMNRRLKMAFPNELDQEIKQCKDIAETLIKCRVTTFQGVQL